MDTPSYLYILFPVRKTAIIWFLCLASAPLSGVAGQDFHADAREVGAFTDRAMRDAAYEHGLRFSNAVDEADYWNDQRDFEQQLFEQYPTQYLGYLLGKKRAYQKHRETCDSGCGHGDFYYRQASFYLQYDPKDEGAFLTLTRGEDTTGWQVASIPRKNR